MCSTETDKFQKVKQSLHVLEKIVEDADTFHDELDAEEKLATHFGKVLKMYYIKDRYDENVVGVIVDVLTDGVELHWNTFSKTVCGSYFECEISDNLAAAVTHIFDDIEYYLSKDGLYF